MSARYTVLDGEVISQERSGVAQDLVPDPLGSTAALIGSSGTITDAWEYWPYGEVRTRTGTTAIPFQFVGTLGYYRDTSVRTYVRARHYKQNLGRWMDAQHSRNGYAVYSYSYLRPTLFAESNISMARLPCRQRSKQYCQDALADRGNNAKLCFCRVSWILCRFVIDRGIGGTPAQRRCADCMNGCLFEYYRDRFTKPNSCWVVATDPVRRRCLYSGDECNWYIRCEQKTFTGCLAGKCASVCGSGLPSLPPWVPNPVPFPFNGPEAARIAAGQTDCCDGGRMGSWKAFGLHPESFIERIDELEK